MMERNEEETLPGGKGANLAEMSSIGLSVPAGFTVTTETCAQFHENGGELPDGCWDEMLEGLAKIEENMGAAQATEQIGDGVSRSTTFTSGWQGASPQEEIVQDLYIKRPLALRAISYGEFAGSAIRVLRI